MIFVCPDLPKEASQILNAILTQFPWVREYQLARQLAVGPTIWEYTWAGGIGGLVRPCHPRAMRETRVAPAQWVCLRQRVTSQFFRSKVNVQ